jgi:hypothetical protein
MPCALKNVLVVFLPAIIDCLMKLNKVLIHLNIVLALVFS